MWENHSDSSVYLGCFIARLSKQSCKHHLHSASQDLCHFCGWTCSQGKNRKDWTHCWISDPSGKCKGTYALLAGFRWLLLKCAECFSSVQNLCLYLPCSEISKFVTSVFYKILNMFQILFHLKLQSSLCRMIVQCSASLSVERGEGVWECE